MHAAANSSFKTKAGQTNLAPELRSRIANHIHVLPRLWIRMKAGVSLFLAAGRPSPKPLSRQLPPLQGPERNGKLHFFFLMRRGRGVGWLDPTGLKKIVQETETLHNLMRGCTSFSAAFGT